MTYANPEALVSTDWLAAHLSDPDVRILDCTWHHASTNLDGRTQYRGRHLPGSVHFDIDHIADTSNPLPHMLPSAADFAKKVGLLGVGDGDRVVVYDRSAVGPPRRGPGGCFGSLVTTRSPCLMAATANGPRKSYPADMSMVRPEQRSFSATFNPVLVRSLREMRENLVTAETQVIDARGPAKFDGTQQDVFPFKKLGHIPNATNIPWADLIDPETGAFIARDALAARFASAWIDLGRPIVTTCASGITSCVVALGLYLLGHKSAAVYDGSWAEWGLAEDTPAVAA